MKQSERYKFLARFTSDLHALLKQQAKAQGRSLQSLINALLEESLKRYPRIEILPEMLQPLDKKFVVRLQDVLHESLDHSSKTATSERSFNLEIVVRLMLMTSPSRPTILDAWDQLNQSIAMIMGSCSKDVATETLREARDKFEWQFRHTLICDAALDPANAASLRNRAMP